MLLERIDIKCHLHYIAIDFLTGSPATALHAVGETERIPSQAESTIDIDDGRPLVERQANFIPLKSGPDDYPRRVPRV